MSSLQLISSFDEFKFKSKDEYSVYYNMLLHSLQGMLVEKKSLALTNQEALLMEQYLLRFIETLKALRLRYLYDENHSVALDMHESGFPSYGELRKMFNELMLVREKGIKIPELEEVKKKVLDFLFENTTSLPPIMMQNASLHYYLNTVKPEDIYQFIRSKLLVSDNTNAPNMHMISWSTYDTNLNRPLIFYMYFKYSGENLENDLPVLHKAIESQGNYLRELITTAHMIDHELVAFHPILLKRVDVGPFFSMLSQEDDIIATNIKKGIEERALGIEDSCLQVTVDILQSIGEKKVTSSMFWAKDHQVFQQYQVPSTNLRGASKTTIFTVGSHEIIQYMSSHKIQLPNYLSIKRIEKDNIQKEL